jgi:superoxide dismutase
MTPVDHGRRADPLAEAIEATFGSIRELKRQVSAAGAARFGSGWSWLVHAVQTDDEAQPALVLIALARSTSLLRPGERVA